MASVVTSAPTLSRPQKTFSPTGSRPQPAPALAPASRALSKTFSSPGRKPGGFRPKPKFAPKDGKPKPEPKTLFQKFFKSVGPRTYVAQVKEASNGNHFVVLTEGKRDPKTDEVRKTSLYLFSEDFDAMRDLLRDTFAWVRDHPVSKQVADKQRDYWKKQQPQQQQKKN